MQFSILFHYTQERTKTTLDNCTFKQLLEQNYKKIEEEYNEEKMSRKEMKRNSRK